MPASRRQRPRSRRRRKAIASADELYAGLHLAQYRHATRSPEPYWREVIGRDAGDSRANTALGEWHLRRGELDRPSATCAPRWSGSPCATNPRDGEASYLLGVVLRLQGDPDGADEAFGKASWDGAFAAAASTARAELASARGDVAEPSSAWSVPSPSSPTPSAGAGVARGSSAPFG